MGYGDVCEAKTRKEMLRRFAILLAEVGSKFHKVDEAMQKSNVGYFAGYYDNATRIRVQKWLGAEHPIFGRSFPTPEEAFKAGEHLGKAMRDKASK